MRHLAHRLAPLLVGRLAFGKTVVVEAAAGFQHRIKRAQTRWAGVKKLAPTAIFVAQAWQLKALPDDTRNAAVVYLRVRAAAEGSQEPAPQLLMGSRKNGALRYPTISTRHSPAA